MKIIIILLKIGIILSYSSTIKMIYDFSKKEHAKLELDLLSRLEVCAVIGINLVGLIAVIDEKTYAFTCGLCCIGILLALFEKYRFVFAGEKNVLLKGKVYALKDLKKLGTGLLTLKVYLRSKPKPMQIYVPLTSSDVMKNKIEFKIH